MKKGLDILHTLKSRIRIQIEEGKNDITYTHVWSALDHSLSFIEQTYKERKSLWFGITIIAFITGLLIGNSL